ncbi:hypothetical protein NE237_000488 [Protea cynaroides]|uniref:Uncharacterized protein n=1 Tax=Protea cynaroides TaxID=273540 RepID=A0A9Q0KRA9_9MAGN|nr:hypothetical protein NE237_000488 [Protea cynaroides]
MDFFMERQPLGKMDADKDATPEVSVSEPSVLLAAAPPPGPLSSGPQPPAGENAPPSLIEVDDEEDDDDSTVAMTFHRLKKRRLDSGVPRCIFPEDTPQDILSRVPPGPPALQVILPSDPPAAPSSTPSDNSLADVLLALPLEEPDSISAPPPLQPGNIKSMPPPIVPIMAPDSGGAIPLSGSLMATLDSRVAIPASVPSATTSDFDVVALTVIPRTMAPDSRGVAIVVVPSSITPDSRVITPSSVSPSLVSSPGVATPSLVPSVTITASHPLATLPSSGEVDTSVSSGTTPIPPPTIPHSAPVGVHVTDSGLQDCAIGEELIHHLCLPADSQLMELVRLASLDREVSATLYHLAYGTNQYRRSSSLALERLRAEQESWVAAQNDLVLATQTREAALAAKAEMEAQLKEAEGRVAAAEARAKEEEEEAQAAEFKRQLVSSSRMGLPLEASSSVLPETSSTDPPPSDLEAAPFLPPTEADATLDSAPPS